MQFERLLERQDQVLFDGALATELERKGADLTGGLWSARVIRDAPHLIISVHEDAIAAGADVISTASYQVSREGFVKAGLRAESADEALIKSVNLAREASKQTPTLIAASLGPYGAMLADGSEYTGHYTLTGRELADFHRPRVKALLEAKPDLILFETLPSLAEAEAVAQLAAEHSDVAFMASFSRVDAFRQALPRLESVANLVAVGLNCMAPEEIEPALKSVRAKRVALSASPNSGETWDAKGRRWQGVAGSETLASWAQKYRAAGARIFGGCCRTKPEDIAEVKKVLKLKGSG
ncbi:MAG: homocysteine S-methyltransferase [Archangium sp.]|nr:homocysteine S-methyltransferase [Archangium sp.]